MLLESNGDFAYQYSLSSGYESNRCQQPRWSGHKLTVSFGKVVRQADISLDLLKYSHSLCSFAELA